MTHYTDEELQRIPIDDPHLSECSDCRKRRRGLMPLPAFLLEAEALQDRLERERAEALEGLEDHRTLAATAGAVQALVQRAHEQLFVDPAASLDAADRAIALARELAGYPEDTIRTLRGDAWKERANVLRVMGRFSEALEAITTAESCYAELAVNAPHLAMAEYVRATILREMGDLDEALRLARSAARVFDEFGYDQRLRHSRNLEASIRYRQGELREALEIYQTLLRDAQTRGDLEDLARLYNNIGSAYVDLHEYEAAVEHYLQAIPLFEELQMGMERARSQWGLARLLLNKGETEHALRWLWRIYNEFNQYAMSEDTALVALDIATGLLTLGKNQEARRVCEHLAARFRPGTDAGQQVLTLLRTALLDRTLSSGPLVQARAVLSGQIPLFLPEG